MAKTIAGLQLEAVTKGPWLARRFPAITNETVYHCVTHWYSLTSSAGEKLWAERIIKKKVCKAFPAIYTWVVKMIVSLLIYWLLNKRNAKFNREVQEINQYLQ